MIAFEVQIHLRMSGGQTIRGGSVSWRMVTLNSHELTWLQSSMARQFTTVVPTGNTLPEGGMQMTVTLVSQSSVAVTVYWMTRLDSQVHLRMSSGQTMRGGSRSRTTCTLNWQPFK